RLLLSALLDEALLQKGFAYQALGDNIIVKRAAQNEGTPSKTDVSQQQRNIRGRVTDEGGEPLAGVNIRLKGTDKTAVTDSEGRFVITGPSGEVFIVFSYVGFTTQEIAVGQTQAD